MRKPTREKKKKGGRKREGEREYARTRVRDIERERKRVVWLTTPFYLDPVSMLESFLPRPLYRQLLPPLPTS